VVVINAALAIRPKLHPLLSLHKEDVNAIGTFRSRSDVEIKVGKGVLEKIAQSNCGGEESSCPTVLNLYLHAHKIILYRENERNIRYVFSKTLFRSFFCLLNIIS
jgi:hypothetical protein